MTLHVRLDPDSPIPHYEQIRAQVAAAVTAGHLRPGQRLPTTRALSATLDVATGTIARAYRELEAEGLVLSRRRHGTTVTDRDTHPDPTVGHAALRLVSAARAHGMGDREIHDLLTAAIATHDASRGGRDQPPA
ncbi:GntR family transcriptional regulator [Cellulomonas bogoriensis]|uniref:Transcriptional regulator n=1 Tax=Cellulomonas bogoriensis 69B4 = DSM 16987 TaxID=1386082 RepID=A0A0A0BLW6_9CELL|nr:GntR family transcriptional regulator [Cellulomonas bogoriensis]KGM08860.1 transcriptional regulator [Cellulomonas bogoriensis 69B4 = DSM 16987]